MAISSGMTGLETGDLVSLSNLPGDIRNNIQRNSSDRVDVMNIVTTALNYADGLEQLVGIVRAFEGDSMPMQNLDRLLT